METKTKTAKLKVVKIEETQFWKPAIANKAGKLFGVYIFDSTQSTHCCEIRASYYLRFMYTFTEEFVDDKTNEEIQNVDFMNGNQDIYIHCGDMDKMKVEAEYEFEYEGESGGENYEEEFESLLDKLAGNPPVC